MPIADGFDEQADRFLEASRRVQSGLAALIEDPPGENGAPEPDTGRRLDLSAALLEFRELVALDIPERKRHLAWLPEGGNVMVFGDRGVGKTNFQLGLTAALTTGQPFLKWPVVNPVGVLYVDGEMALDELRGRITAFLTVQPKTSLFFLTSEWVYQKLNRDLVLTGGPMRAAVMEILDAHPEIRVLVIDNISCLFSGLNEDKKQDWEPINTWLVRLRHRGLTTVLVHHAGKGGQQRGTSGREDSLDTVIRLDHAPDYEPREGCHFELRFTKSRSARGEDVDPLDVRLNEAGTWAYKPLDETKAEKAKRLFEEGVTSPTDMADMLGGNKGYYSRIISRLRGAQGGAS